MVLRDFEDRLERLVEGMFARAFRTGLQPVEIGRRLVKDLDARRQLDTQGHPVGPNRFVVRLATDDLARFDPIHESLVGELRTMVREHAVEEGVRFLGPVVVELHDDPDSRVGMFRVEATFDETVSPTTHLAYLDLPDGHVVALTATTATIGRLPESTIVLSDPNASRHHAELRPAGDSFELVDLESTNGSSVNGTRVSRKLLRHGDELTFGSVAIRFRLA